MVKVSFDRCLICKREIPWGRFAYNQELCWSCFKDQVNDILELPLTDLHKSILKHMVACMAEIFNEKI